MRYNNRKRKAANDTPEQVLQRVHALITSFLDKHGCSYQRDGSNTLFVHRPDNNTSTVLVRAYYGDEKGTYVLVETIISGRRTVSGERSATQKLYNHCHSIITEWAESIGVTS
ncbi:hypothetical protein SEA_BURRO_25 [Microbacterium phage Burro]|uniref:Uncharacterized protein n=1 Tax=Microbacterium phage Burro TaxID=2315703 RepID=A0A386KKI2_9CAUD|nr:hypothetical protein HWB89_gp25 [Microbacterium phage Burro]AYD86168.1 hypothetical protein SEA_BURRO_25 [Microbacterium phage Burro]